jgi:hypothetical protein
MAFGSVHTPPAQHGCPTTPQAACATHTPAVHVVFGSVHVLPVQQG